MLFAVVNCSVCTGAVNLLAWRAASNWSTFLFRISVPPSSEDHSLAVEWLCPDDEGNISCMTGWFPYVGWKHAGVGAHTVLEWIIPWPRRESSCDVEGTILHDGGKLFPMTGSDYYGRNHSLMMEGSCPRLQGIILLEGIVLCLKESSCDMEVSFPRWQGAILFEGIVPRWWREVFLDDMELFFWRESSCVWRNHPVTWR